MSRSVPGQGAGLSALPWPVWLYLFCVLFQIGFEVGPLMMTTLRLFLLVMVVPLYVNLFAGRYGRIYATDILFPLYILWTAIAIEVNSPGRALELVGSTAAEFLGGYVLARAYIRTPEAFEALIRALLLVIVLMVPLAVFEALTGLPPLIEMLRNLGLSNVTNVQAEMRLGLERVQGSFVNPIHFGLFCSTVFALVFVSLKGSLSTGARYAGTAAVALCVFVSLSSGALLAVVLQVILIVWAAAFAGFKSRWYLLLGLVMIMYVVIDLLSNRTPVDVFLSYATLSAHTAYWRKIIFEWGMKNIWANPVFGIGLRDWVRPSFMFSGSMDNFWLLQTMRHGIPAFLLLASGYLIGLAKVIRRDFSTDPRLRQLRLGWVIVIIGLTFTLSTVAIWTNIFSYVFFLYGAGFWLIAAQPAGTAPADPAPPLRGGGPGPRRADPAGPAVAGPAPAAAVDAPPGPRYTRFPPSSPAQIARRADRPLPKI